LWDDALTSSDSADKFFKLLNQWRRRKYLITVGTPSEDVRSYSSRRRMSNIEADEVERLYKKAGLAMGHAYTVLDVRHFPVHRLC
ncbi:calpain family cysteine protease-like protein, partial [Trypanosoma theileri]